MGSSMRNLATAALLAHRMRRSGDCFERPVFGEVTDEKYWLDAGCIRGWVSSNETCGVDWICAVFGSGNAVDEGVEWIT